LIFKLFRYKSSHTPIFTGLKLNLLFNSKFYRFFNTLAEQQYIPKMYHIFSIISNRATSNSPDSYDS